MSDVPVLVVAFNRPDRLTDLIDRLRVARPRRVYVAVDGPRSQVAGDAAQVLATQAAVTAIDWTDDVRTRFRQDNAGCGRGVSQAIDWLFSHEQRGIVIEDDVLPVPSFFPFCEELLERYEHDDRVWAVSGCNFVPSDHIGTTASYRFTTVPHVWGWATWRRSWSAYRYELGKWRTRSNLRSIWQASGSPWSFAYWFGMFEITSRGLIDTWDYQADLAAFSVGGLTATSNTNLVTNVGFGADASHTARRPAYLREASDVSFPLRHPATVRRDARSEEWTRINVLGATSRGMVAQGRRFLSGRRPA